MDHTIYQIFRLYLIEKWKKWNIILWISFEEISVFERPVAAIKIDSSLQLYCQIKLSLSKSAIQIVVSGVNLNSTVLYELTILIYSDRSFTNA